MAEVSIARHWHAAQAIQQLADLDLDVDMDVDLRPAGGRWRCADRRLRPRDR